MGYKREKLQILGGGWNPQPPGDKVPKQDMILAQNWRVDRTGRLVSRWGYPIKFTISGMAFAHSGACAGGVEGDYYIGANTTGGSCSVYYDPDHISSPIVTGLSGNRVGMVQDNGSMWIMDTAASGSYTPGGLGSRVGWQAWGVPAPSSALVPSVGATVTGSDPGPSGTYQFYCTFECADNSYETNPGPLSAPVTVANQEVDFSSIPVCNTSTYPLMATIGGEQAVVNIYAIGGTLEEPYLCCTVLNGTTTGIWGPGESDSAAYGGNDVEITDAGFVLATNHGLPPAGAGLAGPYLSRLYTWVGNRLYYTQPGLPQYWNTDVEEGDWVDVGQDGENIIWCTVHANYLTIYKERSVWYLAGDPATGTLNLLEDGVGLTSAFAVTAAGAVDYFVSPNALRRCNVNLGRTENVSGEIESLFNSNITNYGSFSPPGSMVPGPDYVSGKTSLDCYAIAVGYAMGKLYVSYGEQVPSGTSSVLMVFDEQQRKWMYHRSAAGSDRYHGFLFDGMMMQGLTGYTGTTEALSVNLDDFRNMETEDEPSSPIEVVYQSHFEDVGLPDTDKVWLEIQIDYVTASDTPTVAAAFNNFQPTTSGGWIAEALGTLPAGGLARQQVSFPLGPPDNPGILARNISVVIDCQATGHIEIHNVYLYYYVESRLSIVASSLPTDLGAGIVKQVKELHLDIDASPGTTSWTLLSDLPGNTLAIREQSGSPFTTGGRAVVKFPFNVVEGFLWRLGVTATTGAFRLYAARLLARPMNQYVEAYESAAGFVWDSQEMTFESGLTHVPRLYALALAAKQIKQFREVSLQIDTFGYAATVAFLTDLPGNIQLIRQTWTVNTGWFGVCSTSGTAVTWVSGTTFDQIPTGVTTIVINGVAYPIASVTDMHDLVLGSSAGAQAGVTWRATAGRRFYRLPLPAGINAPVEGRMCRVQISGGAKFVLYDGEVEVLPVGTYIEAYEAAAGAVWDSRAQDFGSANPKEAREIELDIDCAAGTVATLYGDLPGYTMAAVYTSPTITTTGRQKIKVQLTTGAAPYAYPVARMFQLILTGTNAFKLYGAKMKVRELGCYLTGDEAFGLGVYDTTPLDLGSERFKEYKKIEIEVQTDAVEGVSNTSGTAITATSGQFLLTAGSSIYIGATPYQIASVTDLTHAVLTTSAGVQAGAVWSIACTLAVYTEQSGTIAQQFSTLVDTLGARTTVKIPLTNGIRGRLVQVIVSGAGVRLFAGRIWTRPMNDTKAQWTWAPLPIPPTAPEWKWIPLPVGPTPPVGVGQDPAQWFWAKILSIDETPDKFELIDVPFEVADGR